VAITLTLVSFAMLGVLAIAGYFQRTFGTRVIVGAGDRAMLASGTNERLCPTDDDARGRLASDQAATYTPFAPDVSVEGSLDLLAETGIPARAVSLPGHTDGSLVVLVPGAALVGDLFRGGIFEASASVHFYMCDLEDNRQDIASLLQTLAPEDVGRMRARIVSELDTTFASHYSETISLRDVLDPDKVAGYAKKSTGAKVLIDPSR
jgi:glyoxylase-like metal-dependent hydrolase (beta-lactamase superfamily II)